MAQYLSNELANTTTGLSTSVPVGYKPAASRIGARTKTFVATVALASQTTSDTIKLFTLPTGATFIKGWINISATLGSSTVAIGNSGTAGKYRAAATATSTDTPLDFGVTAAVAAAPLAAEEDVIVTIATANLPASGTMTVTFLVAAPN